MPRKFIRRYIPDHKTLVGHKTLRVFGSLLHDPNLWHLNRRSASGAVAVGLFMAFMPVPFQMLLAAGSAIVVRVNVAIAVALVWISNPLTMAPLFYLAFKVGTLLMGVPTPPEPFELTNEWLLNQVRGNWQPFLLGCVVMGSISGLAGYLTVRILWRLHLIRYLERRRNLLIRRRSGQQERP